MRSERIRWKDWNAMRCVAHGCELVVGTSAGPRILSLRFGSGPNLLYQDTTHFRVGEWRLHGGHRFTVGPEGEQSYHPDNAPCSVDVGSGELRVAAPAGLNRLRRVLSIRAADEGAGAGFDVLHVLQNLGEHPWRGALWGITCVPRTGRVVAPVPRERLRFWPGTNPAHWTLVSGHLTNAAKSCREKVGWHGDPAWLAVLQPDATLVIHCPDPPPLNQCVDGGCNIEVFTCADYIELETLGGETQLNPGDEATHLQRWRLLGSSPPPRDWRTIGAQAGCMPLPCPYAS